MPADKRMCGGALTPDISVALIVQSICSSHYDGASSSALPHCLMCLTPSQLGKMHAVTQSILSGVIVWSDSYYNDKVAITRILINQIIFFARYETHISHAIQCR